MPTWSKPMVTSAVYPSAEIETLIYKAGDIAVPRGYLNHMSGFDITHVTPARIPLPQQLIPLG